jgi:hypothetical protein
MENRNTILVNFQVEPADAYAERRAASAMVDERVPGRRRITLGGDKGYDTRDFIEACRTLTVTPHDFRDEKRGTARGISNFSKRKTLNLCPSSRSSRPLDRYGRR